MKILVTTGTAEEYSFNRLLKIIDELCSENVIDKNELIVQADDRKYNPVNYRAVRQFSSSEFLKVIEHSEIIISHAGTGTVINSLKLGKKVILFPRMKEYGEHLDDHQMELCKLFEDKNYVLVAKNKEELKNFILNIEKYKLQKYISNTGNFIRKIVEIIENI